MTRRPSLLSPLLPSIATALCYMVAGWLSLALAIPPSYAAPLFPSAGIALAATLVYGVRALPGVAVGGFMVNIVLAATREQPLWPALAVPVAIGVGAMLQAAAGAALVRRYVSQPLTLDEPRDVARFFVLGALMACVVNATLSVGALRWTGAIGPANVRDAWWSWWAGDSLGVLIGAPVALTLIGRPREVWRYRRTTVGLSLVIVTALLAAAAAQVARWDRQRAWAIFERDATRAASTFSAQLQQPLFALQAVRGALQARGTPSSEALKSSAAYWLQQPYHLKAIGWAQQVPRTAIPVFEQEARDELARPDYRVFDRHDKQSAPEAGADPAVVTIRRIEPMTGNAGALGVNILSIAPARPAVLQTLQDGRPAASGGFRLTQDTQGQTGLVIYQGLQMGPTRGLVFVTLQIEQSFAASAAGLPSYLGWCLIDVTPRALGFTRLAGAPGCELQRNPSFIYRQTIPFAERQWELQIRAAEDAVPDPRHWNAWMFSLAGLMATAMLGALLLNVTGRARRIETAVAERTVDLEREIAERRRTEAALRESEQRFRNILDRIPIGVIYADLNGRIREANPYLREMIGYTPKELEGQSSLHITHPEDRAGDISMARQLIAGELPMYRRRKRYIAKDGHLVWVQATVSLLRDEHGAPQRMVGVVEDITEHLRLQDAERAREHAEAASQAKSEFVSRMSHELRTPLNAMLGFAQLLELDRNAPLAEHQRQWTAQIQQAGWHLLHMINDTLDLSRIEAGALRLDLGPVPVAEAVAATRALVEQAAERRHVTITDEIEPGLAVQGDATRVKQILTNLLSNAVKYNVEGGTLHVRARRHDGHTAEIEVRDTGLGMTPAQMRELFQPFNRLGRDNYGEGTGIGLVISRRLAELMNGELTAESAPGQGSVFRLRLPLAAELAADPPTAVPAHDDADGRGYRQRVVHYIEDNETNAEVMRGILAQRPQVRLQVSDSGRAGLAAVRAQPPSLVLLDMHLPDTDGLDLLRELKLDPRTAAVPVVVVSADATTARIQQALALGAAHYVTKPVHVPDMLALLDELLAPQDTVFGSI